MQSDQMILILMHRHNVLGDEQIEFENQAIEVVRDLFYVSMNIRKHIRKWSASESK